MPRPQHNDRAKIINDAIDALSQGGYGQTGGRSMMSTTQAEQLCLAFENHLCNTSGIAMWASFKAQHTDVHQFIIRSLDTSTNVYAKSLIRHVQLTKPFRHYKETKVAFKNLFLYLDALPPLDNVAGPQAEPNEPMFDEILEIDLDLTKAASLDANANLNNNANHIADPQHPASTVNDNNQQFDIDEVDVFQEVD